MTNISIQGVLIGTLATVLCCAGARAAETAAASTNANASTNSAVIAAPAAVSTNAISTNTVAKTDDLFPDRVLAKGKGFEVRQSKLENALVAFRSSMAARGQDINVPDEMLKKGILRELVNVQILLTLATAEEKTKARDLTDKFLAELQKEVGSEDLFKSKIKAIGVTFDQYKDGVFEQNLCELVLDRELRSKIKVTDEQAKKFYDENVEEFNLPEMVRASYILFVTFDKDTQIPLSQAQKAEKEKLAREIKARADKGEDFASLVKQYSEEPGVEKTGGEYTFARDARMPKEFEAAAFSMQTNQISDLVETSYGYYIIKLLEKIPARKVELAEVNSKIKTHLADQEFQKQQPAYMEKIRKDAGVEYADEKGEFKPVTTEVPATTAPASTNVPAAVPSTNAPAQ